MLKIAPTPPPAPDYETLWLKAFFDAVRRYNAADGEGKIITAGVKYIIASRNHKNKRGMNEIQSRYELIDILFMFLGMQTPKRMMQLFPPEKRYDGGKDFKDYFSTMKFIMGLSQDEPIGDERNVFNFLWDYENFELTEFAIEFMDNMEDMAHQHGEAGPGDKLIEEMGLETYTLCKDERTGQEFMLSNKTGKTCPVSTKPRLKVVKANDR